MARNFLWDPIEDNVIAEFDDAGNLLVNYTTEPDLYGNVISQHRHGETNVFYSDSLGSTVAVTNQAGDVVATRAYSAFGETTESTGSIEFPFQFVGQKGYYFDSTTGDYYVRRRGYRPRVSRWLSIDPPTVVSRFFRAKQSLADYIYSNNATLSFVDSSGRWPKPLPISESTKTERFIGKCRSSQVFLSVSFFDVVGGTGCENRGILVQHINIGFAMESCDSCNPCAMHKIKKGKVTDNFFEFLGESFAITGGETAAEIQLGFTDKRSSGPNEGVGTCGAFKSLGELRYYCGDADDFPEILLWKKGKDIGIPSGELPATLKTPKFWDCTLGERFTVWFCDAFNVVAFMSLGPAVGGIAP